MDAQIVLDGTVVCSGCKVHVLVVAIFGFYGAILFGMGTLFCFDGEVDARMRGGLC